MSTACDNFKPHRWKPKQCAACFKPKAEHKGITSEESSGDGNSQTTNSAKMKQSPFYKRFSFSDEDNVDIKAISRDPGPTQTVQHATAPTSSDTVVTSADKLQKPNSGKEADETNENHSSSPPTSVVESNRSKPEPQSEPVSSNKTIVKDEAENSQDAEVIGNNNSDMSGNTPPRPPPPRARSHTVAAPQIKPRKHIPEPSDSQFTLPRSLQPVPAPRRNRINRSISPTTASSSLDDSSIGRAKSLDNLDVSPSTDRRVKFNLETTTIPDTSIATKKNATINPYAVSNVSDVVSNGSTEVMQDKNSPEKCMEDDNDDHEYIEADQLNAAVVSVTELKSKHRNGKPSQVTKYSTLSALQPSRQQNGRLVGGTKQKVLSSGTITMMTTPRRHAPPPPGAPRSRSATITSIDRVRMQNYSAPRRPPPPAAIYYTNAKVAKSLQANVTPVPKVPPPKPARTPSTFDYENVNETISTDVVEYSVIDNDNDVTSKGATKNAAPSGPKKPVRMPKEATPVSDGDQPSSQPKGRYIDLDIDQLTDQQSTRQIMKYQNFDDFSPRPVSPERTSPDCFNKSSSPFEGASQVHDAILNSLNAASAELRKFYFSEFSFMGKMACSKWSNFDPAPSGAVSCVKYNGKLLSLQVNC